MAGPTPDELHRAWVDARVAVEAFEHAALDEAGRARLEELRAHEAELAERARAAGVVLEATAPRTGLWAPLPMFEAVEQHSAPIPPGDEEPTDAPASAANDEVARLVSSMYTFGGPGRSLGKLTKRLVLDDLCPADARLLAAALEDFGQPNEAASLRLRHGLSWPDGVASLPWPPPSALCEAAPFLPSERDGFTDGQRALVESLAVLGTAAQRVEVVLTEAQASSAHSPEELARALDELLLPRPYPIVERDPVRPDEARVRLTPLALEMIEVRAGEAPRVHGGLIPNLLINGCAAPFAFPPLHLTEVIEAARIIAQVPGADVSMLMTRVWLPSIPARFHRVPRTLFDTGRGELELAPAFTIDQDRRAITLSQLPPGVSAEGVVEAIEAARTSGTLEGVQSCTVLEAGKARLVVEHPAFLGRALRLLHAKRLLVRRWNASFQHAENGQSTWSWLGRLLVLFLSRTRTVIAKRFAAADNATRARLQQLEELERAQRSSGVVNHVLDLALDLREAAWGLSNLTSPEFKAHPAFNRVEVGEAQPFSEHTAMLLAKHGVSKARRAAKLPEASELVDQLTRSEASWRSPASLDERVFEALDNIARQYGGPPRPSIVEEEWKRRELGRMLLGA